MTIVIIVLALLVLLAWRLAFAFVKPFRPHKFCGGKGLDPYCRYKGKLPRFGARWVRREVVENWRNS
jgi:hypothetical protein